MKELMQLFSKYCDEVVSDDMFLVIAHDSTGFVESETGEVKLTFDSLGDLKYQLDNEVNRKE